MTLAGARGAACVRAVTGVLFLAEAYGKLTGRFLDETFRKSAEEMAREGWPFWRSFLQLLVLPHSQLFAWVVALGELAIGLGLFLGFLTRVASAGGAALMVTILLGQSYLGRGGGWNDWVTAGLTTKFALLLLLSLFAANAGQAWGLDARLQRRP
ncbi:MAG TPA: DoxX family protein [Thermoanaerobaculia bacterium]|nr:DoxX family protein [Thermoanaerobaculia bacterium]